MRREAGVTKRKRVVYKRGKQMQMARRRKKRKYVSETARAGVKLIKGCEGKKVARQSNVGKTRP